MSTKKVILFFLVPIILSVILHWRVFSLDVLGFHVWRQAQTQTVVYTFSTENNSILHPLRFDGHDGTREVLYEFPLYQWLIAQINKSIGYSVLNSRVFSFFCFLFFLLAFYKLNRLFFEHTLALIVNALLCFSPLLFYYSVNPMPDIMALCLGTWGLYFFYADRQKPNTFLFLLSVVFLSLATLIKLPYLLFAAVALPFLSKKDVFKNKQSLIRLAIAVVTMLPAILWYCRAIPTWQNNGITKGIMASDKTLLQWLDDLQFNLISFFPDLLCNYGSCLFLILGVYFYFKHKKWQHTIARSFTVLFGVLFFYLLFELNMMGKTHDYYLMPFIVPLFALISRGVQLVLVSQHRWFVVVALIAVPILAFFRVDHRWNEAEPGYPIAFSREQNTVQSILPKNALCVVDADESRYIALYFFKRKGFSLLPGELSPNSLMALQKEGADYLVTTNQALDTSQFQHTSFSLLSQQNLIIYKITAR